MAPATDYSKLKVADLKDILKSRDLAVSGLKADLVARLVQADEGLTASGTEPNPTDGSKGEGGGEALQEEAEEEQDANGVEEVGVQARVKRPVEEGSDEAMQNGEGAAATRGGGSEAKRARVDSPPPNAAPSTSTPTPAAPSFSSAPAPGPSSNPPPLGPLSQPLAVPAASLPLPSNGADKRDEQALAQAEVEAPEEEDEDGWVDYEAQFRAEEERERESGRPKDLYLDTISRPSLDFDFERLCSVTLTHNHIYCCLICGRYFSGRSPSTPAYAHSIGEDHHVYINLDSQKVYVLPDGYEVDDPSLADIKYALAPTFTPELVARLDANTTPYRDLAQKPYYPGFVGLNNMKSNSYMNAILHSLVHVPPLRNYFLLTPLPSFPHPSSVAAPTELVTRFAQFVRKVWNPRLFKAQVSPHELLQEVGNRSEGKFRITEPGDPVEFLGWVLNTLHRDLGGSRKPNSSIIYSTFQGELRVDDQAILKSKVTDKVEAREVGGVRFDVDREIKSITTPFLFLALDLPPPPLFQDALASNIIPQVPLSVVLSKYDGHTAREEGGKLRRWKVTKLPPFVIMVYKRFLSNRFLEEKNPTIVNYPVRGVEMGDYVDSSASLGTVYDLVSNLTHSSTAATAAASTSGSSESPWKVHVHLRPARDEETGELDGKKGLREEDDKWFEVADLDVAEVEKGLVPLGETYIQIWERRTPTGTHLDIKVEVPKAKGGKFDKTSGKSKAVPALAGSGTGAGSGALKRA
ncbi:hypothetical protein JCM11251_005404 [Rhodosporidiobolus azoricus]